MFKRKPRRSREFKKNDRVIDFEEAREARRQKREKLAKTTRHYRKAKTAKEKTKAGETRNQLQLQADNRLQTKNGLQLQTQKPNSGRGKTRNRRKRVIYLLIIGIILAVICFYAVNIISFLNEREEARQENINLEKQKERLENQLKNSNTEEFVEQQARSQLSMIKPGETVYVLPKTTTGGAADDEQIKE